MGAGDHPTAVKETIGEEARRLLLIHHPKYLWHIRLNRRGERAMDLFADATGLTGSCPFYHLIWSDKEVRELVNDRLDRFPDAMVELLSAEAIHFIRSRVSDGRNPPVGYRTFLSGTFHGPPGGRACIRSSLPARVIGGLVDTWPRRPRGVLRDPTGSKPRRTRRYRGQHSERVLPRTRPRSASLPIVPLLQHALQIGLDHLEAPGAHIRPPPDRAPLRGNQHPGHA